jgi:hypothetical protein
MLDVWKVVRENLPGHWDGGSLELRAVSIAVVTHGLALGWPSTRIISWQLHTVLVLCYQRLSCPAEWFVTSALRSPTRAHPLLWPHSESTAVHTAIVN